MGVEWQGQVGGPHAGFEKSFSAPDTQATSVWPDSRDGGTESAGQTTYLAASEGGQALLLPGGGFLFHADFAHEGADLVITGAEGGTVVIIDYFAGAGPGDLMTLDGHLLPGDLVQSLAGPAAPVQVAQLAALPDAPPEIGQVQEVEGSVTATGADGLTVELGIGSSVYQGDVLETSADGAVNILFLDGTTFALGGDAKMVLDQLIYDASANTGSSLMSVLTGTFIFITGEVAKTGPEAMQVRTPAGTIGIRGTKVGCNLDISDGVSICVLLPDADGTVGEFVFSNESGSQVVSNAFEAVIANAFNASLTVSQVLPSQLQAIFEGLPTSVLEAQAAPAVLGAGGTFFDFHTSQIGLLRGLLATGVLDDLILDSELVFGSNIDDDANSLAIAASLFIAEPTADGPGTLSIGNLSLVLQQSVELLGFSVTANGAPFALTVDGVPVDLVQNGNTVEGSLADGELIFRFVLDPDSGSITFFLTQPLDHQNPDATGAADTIEFSFEVEVTFIDGTSQTTLVQAIILDAGPTATTTSNAVDEASELGATVAGNLAIVPGNDGLQSIALDGLTATSGGSVIALTSGGEAVLAPVLVAANTFQGKTASGEVVYEIAFDPATGDYSFTLIAPLDHPDAGADTITLTFDVPVTDGDGDTVISTIVIQVADDVVIAQADDGGTVAEATVAPVEGNVTDNDDSGADGFGTVLQFVHDGVVYTPDADGVITIATALGGSFTFDFNTGAYSYVAPDSVDNSAGDPLETFTYTVADGDGDTSTATLTIAVSDANAPTAEPDVLAIDEAEGDGNALDPFNAFTPIVRLGNLTDNDDPGGDGFGTVRITGASYDVQGLGALTQAVDEDADSITFTGDGWTLEIDKLTGDYTFTQTGAIDHRALSGVAEFGYTIQDSDGTTSSASFTVTIADDGIAASDDDGGAIQEGSATTLSGSVFDNDDPGADGFGGVTQFAHNGQTYSLASTTAQPGFVSLVGTVITITTEQGGTLVFDFATGDYSYTAPVSVDNSSGDPVEAFVYTVADVDGDTAIATLRVTVTDANAPAAVPDTLLVNEAEGDPTDLGDGSAFTAIVRQGSLTDNDNPGADGFGAPKVTAASYDVQGLGALTQPVDEDADSITFTGSGWTLVIYKATGDYTFTQTGPIDHEALSGVAEFGYTIQDLDGQTSSTTLTITITDDGIVANDDDGGVVDEDAATSGNLLTNDDSGVDGFGVITEVVHGGVAYTAVDGVISFTTALGGTFSLDVASGEYTYTAPALDTISGDGTETFRYTVIDGDGDAAVATLTIDVDDRPEARDDQNAATEGGASVAGNVLGNDVIGDAPGRVTQISFTTTDAAAAAFYAGLGDADIVVTENAGVFTITVAVAAGGAKIFATLAGGELTINSDGSYTYAPPPSGALREDATETFTYTVVDSDGDSDTATLTITVDDVIEPAGAFLVTNTNAGLQDLRLIVTSNDANVEGSGTPTTAGGQAGTVPLGGGVVFEQTDSYAVIVKFESGSGTTNLTDLDLIFDLEAADLDDPDNVFLTLLDQGTIQLGDQGGSVDGVIWQIEFDAVLSDFVVSDAILYDIQSDPTLGDIVVFDTALSNTSFDLDFSLLPTARDPFVAAENALFGDIEVIDISGSNAEVNTLRLNAQDVIDVIDVTGDNELIIIGDDGILFLTDPENWQDDDLSTAEIDPIGSTTINGEIFDVYAFNVDGVSGTLSVDSDLTVQFETAMA